MKGGVVVSTQGLHWPRSVLKAATDQAIGLPVVRARQRLHRPARRRSSPAPCRTTIGPSSSVRGPSARDSCRTSWRCRAARALKLTTAIYLTPDGRDINKLGIRPDEVVSDNPKTKADEVLQAALKYIAAQ